MYATAADEAKAGTLGGKFELYGLNSKGCAGAELLYTKDKELNPSVPQEIVDEIQAVKKKFAYGELKISVTKEDARGGL
jgi:basic membrane protein A and related proteins